MAEVVAPLPGEVVELAAVPDPVFAQGIVGPGLAIEPGDDESCTVCAPISGTLVKVKPHAFVILSDDGVGILVHLGIDTVKLDGAGFDIRAVEGSVIAAGEPVISWNPKQIRERGLSAIVPVVAVDVTADRIIETARAGTSVAVSDQLFGVAS